MSAPDVRAESADQTPRIVALIIWLALVAVLLYNFRTGIARLDLRDTDDALRLVQIRDWMAGQGWFDVTQHRVNPPHGGIMHWSRLIDVPIAAMILFFRLFFAPPVAEQIAIALYPMLLIGVLMALLARFVTRLAGRDTAVVALLMAATSTFVLNQFVPMRIDHHGPQILIALALLFPVLAPPTRRSGLIAGALFALYLSISFEGLPYLALVGALFAWGYVRGHEDGTRLAAFAMAFAGLSPLILAATRGLSALGQNWCDAWSAPYWMATGAASLVLITGIAAVRARPDWRIRAGVVLAAGAVGAIVFALRDKSCLAGPFANLDPLVRTIWHKNVLEGQPVWSQSRTFMTYLIVPSVIGIGATAFAWRRDANAARRAQWGILLFMLVGAFAAALMVARAISVVHVYALPGLAYATMRLVNGARAQPRLVPRVALTIPALFLAPAMSGITADVAVAAIKKDDTKSRPRSGLMMCQKSGPYRSIAALPETRVFAQIDLASHLLLYSHHSVIATPHHRNDKAMAVVYRGFTAAPADAEAIVRGSGSSYLLFCGKSGETKQMIRRAPKGLAAALQKDATPSWLTPVYRDPKSTLVLYRLTPP